MLRSKRISNLYRSMETQQIRSTGSNVWFSLVVTLKSSDNKYLNYPARGVIRVCEQGTHLGVTSAVFHQFKAESDGVENGELLAPVEVRNPVFTFDGGI